MKDLVGHDGPAVLAASEVFVDVLSGLRARYK
jgi:hypothetical protein